MSTAAQSTAMSRVRSNSTTAPDGDDAMPPGIPASLAKKIMIDNPRATYFEREPIKGTTTAAAQ